MRAKFLAARIKRGFLTIEQVPESLRAAVEALLVMNIADETRRLSWVLFLCPATRRKTG